MLYSNAAAPKTRRHLSFDPLIRQIRLRAKQFGTDGKREWVVGMGCYISGKSGTKENPVDPAHIGRTRGAGADSSRILGLLRFPYHVDYDDLPKDKFEAKHPATHAELEEAARQLDEDWQRKQTRGETDARHAKQ